MTRLLRYIFCIFSMISLGEVLAQNFGNEWIDYSRDHYKFAISQKGIHRIDYSTLQNSGFPVNSTDPRSLKLFAKGQEQYIYIQGEADGTFNPGDFIEFYAEPNDGKLDSVLYYTNGLGQGTKANSLFNDTIYYFLAITSSNIGNKRYTQETDINFGAYSAAPYYMSINEQSFYDAYHIGRYYNANMQDPRYTESESYAKIFTGAGSYIQGWNGIWSSLNNTMYTAGPPAKLDVWIAGASDPATVNIYDHYYLIKFGGQTNDTATTGFQFTKLSYLLPAANVASASNAMEVDFTTAFSPDTRNALTYLKTEFPQQYNLSGRFFQTLYIDDNPNEVKYTLNISNFNSLGTAPRFYDLTNGRRIDIVQNGTDLQLIVPNGNGRKKCYLSSDTLTISVPTIQKVYNPNGNNGKFRNFLTDLKDYDYLVITEKSLWNASVHYTAYRNLTGFNALTVDIEELYNQFAWGIPKHPVSIVNFLKFTLNKWTLKPKNVFLIGKGYRWDFARFDPTFYNENLIPAIGNPPTDNIYVHNLDGFQTSNNIAIGRLSAQNQGDVNLYLQKIIQYESNALAPWMKRVMHFGGGDSQQEQNVLANYLNQYKHTIEDTLFGGQVTTFLKSSNAPLLQTIADSVKTLINEGISLMTFFGHAAGSGFDTNIDDPSEYNNTGKYPVILANSCFSGDLFQNYRSVSEKFVLEPQKGSSAFISSVSAGLSPYLAYYSSEWYNSTAWRQYNKSIGLAMREASGKCFTVNGGSNIYAFVTGLEMSLHGDPAIKINSAEKPDLMVSSPQIFFDPVVVNTDIDSFEVKAIIFNQGRTFTSSFQVELKRDFPNPGKADEFFTKTMLPFNYVDTISFKIAVDPVNGPGLNVFTISVDAFDVIDEVTNSNNQASKNLLIGTAEIIPVYPYQFAVIPKNNSWLKASTGDPFAPLKTYKIQIDTTDLFNSPFLKDTIISQVGGVVKWKPAITFTDSTVYFWRAGIDSLSTGIFHKWRESSFQYIPGKYGWGQDHFFQFKNDQFSYILYNRPQRTFDFSPNLRQLKCVTVGTPQDQTDLSHCMYDLDGVLQEYGACGNEVSIHVAVIDPVTLTPWGTRYNGQNPNNNFGNANDNGACRSRVEQYFIFRTQDNTSRDAFKNMLNNSIPNGHYVLIWTMRETQFQAFMPDQLQALTTLGADSVQGLANFASNRPWIFFTRKGYPSTDIEVVGADAFSTISLTTILQNEWTFGTMKSPLIGPASKWNSFHWRQFALENPTEDSVSVDIYGVTSGGIEVPMFTGVQPSTPDILNLFNTIDASVYPYLRLREFTRDDTTRTPAQMDRWHVLFDGVPEAALNPSIAYLFNDDTLQQGQTLKFASAIENIGDFDMDSLTVKYFIIDHNNQQTTFYKKLDSLRINQFLVDTFTIGNLNYPGINSLWVEVNPFEQNHQQEQFHFNNIGQKIFLTATDKINPLLDVTFDGVRIMNNELVSGKPDILVKLKDENKVRLMNDTAAFELYLKKPAESLPKRLNFGMSEITFTPAVDVNNTCKIEYKPDFTDADGTYELRIRAKDASNNQSGKGDGTYDYNIQFQVINKSSITEVLNYPNPFSTSTRFVFTLTGSELPTFMKIQILTIDGTVVKEIFQSELGQIRIGKNITEYAWNGTDEFGDRLASGVYLYRVITNINGKEIDKLSTNADKYFKKGWGKMYLMR